MIPIALFEKLGSQSVISVVYKMFSLVYLKECSPLLLFHTTEHSELPRPIFPIKGLIHGRGRGVPNVPLNIIKSSFNITVPATFEHFS